MRKAKKIFALFVAALMLATGLFTGCGQQGGTENDSQQEVSAATSADGQSGQNVYDNGLPKDEKVSLKVAAPDQGYGKEMYETMVNNFMKMYPNVTIELATSPQISELVTTRISANDDSEMYHLIFNKAGYTTMLSDSDAVEDLSGLMDMPSWDDKDVKMGQDVPEGFRRAYTYKDKLDLIPTDLTLISIIYNKAMFEENGWNQNPKTWDEFLQLCETIKSSGKTAPIAFAGTVDYLPWLTNVAGIYAGGKDWEERYIRRDKGIYSDPATLAPLKKLKELKDKGYFLKGSEALDHTQSQMEFLQGNAAMIPCGSWIENEMKESAPDGFQYGMMFQPTNDSVSDTRYMYVFSNSSWMWAKKPELEKKWAKELLRYYFSKEIQTICIKSGMLPIAKSVLKDESVRQFATSFNQEMLKLLSGNMEPAIFINLNNPPKVGASTKYSEVVNSYDGQYLAVYFGQKTPEQVGKEADIALEKAWEDVGGR